MLLESVYEIKLFEETFHQISLFKIKKLKIYGVGEQNYGTYVVYKGLVPVACFFLGSDNWKSYKNIDKFAKDNKLDFFLFLYFIIWIGSKKKYSLSAKKEGVIMLPATNETNNYKTISLHEYDIDEDWFNLTTKDLKKIVCKTKFQSKLIWNW